MDTLTFQAVSLLNYDPAKIAIPDYVDFCINGQPLADIIDESGALDAPLLSKFTSVLGTMEETNFDRLKILQLKGEAISKNALEALFPAAQFDQRPIWDELKLKKVLLYCCAECGDYKCGGYFVSIKIDQSMVEWNLDVNGKMFQFRFDKSHYMTELDNYLNNVDEMYQDLI